MNDSDNYFYPNNNNKYMKKFLTIMLLIPTLALVWGCKDDDDDENTSNLQKGGLKEIAIGSPDWDIDLFSNEQTPDWVAPDPALYESWMIMMVRLQEEMKPYVTDEDMVAIFIDGELRAVNHPAKPADGQGMGEDESTYFILKILGNERTGQEIELTLKYWSSKLHQTFSISGTEIFVPEKVQGVDSELLIPIIKGSSKYPVATTVNLYFSPEEHGFISSPSDIVGAFINGQCRGIKFFNNYNEQKVVFSVLSKQEGEEVLLYYYNLKLNKVFDLGKTFETVKGEVEIHVN